MAWRQSYQLDETRSSNSAVCRPAICHGNLSCRLLRLTAEACVRHGGRTDELDAFVGIGSTVEVVEEPLATTEQDGHEGQMHLVDQTGPEVLLVTGQLIYPRLTLPRRAAKHRLMLIAPTMRMANSASPSWAHCQPLPMTSDRKPPSR